MPGDGRAAVHSEAVHPGAAAAGAPIGGRQELRLTGPETTSDDATPEEPTGSVQFLGQYLLSEGLITAEDLEAALDYQDEVNVPLGALALSRGLLSEKQLLHTHAHQRNSAASFGEVAVRLGFLTRAQLDDLVREEREGRVFLGEALVQRGALDREQLAAALERYKADQKLAEAHVRRTLNGLPDFLLVAPAIQLTTRMLLRTAEIVVKVSAISQDTRLAPREHTIWQVVEGDRAFTYVLNFDGPELLDLGEALLEEMLEEDEMPTDVDEMVIDAGKEFVNVVVGHICTWLSREGLDTMPQPPEAGPGDAVPPCAFDDEVRRVHVSLVSARGSLGLALLVPASGPPELEWDDDFA